MKLSDHFTLAEAVKSQAALRLGIDNTPPAPIIPRLRLVAEHILEPIRARYGVPIVPSSWYRCPALNRAIGGRDTSQHVTGEAVDFEVPGVSNFEVALFLCDRLAFDQMILEFFDGTDPHSGWVHCSYGAAEPVARQEALIFDGKSYRIFNNRNGLA